MRPKCPPICGNLGSSVDTNRNALPGHATWTAFCLTESRFCPANFGLEPSPGNSLHGYRLPRISVDECRLAFFPRRWPQSNAVSLHLPSSVARKFVRRRRSFKRLSKNRMLGEGRGTRSNPALFRPRLRGFGTRRGVLGRGGFCSRHVPHAVMRIPRRAL